MRGTRWYAWCRVLVIVLAVTPWRTPALGQRTPPTTESAMAGCPRLPNVAPPSEEKRREARALAAQAQQASIVGDNGTARQLFRRAVQLDPADANTVYALARVEDAARDSHAAMMAYCRFLALAPNAPEAEEVRGRIASLVLAETQRPQKGRETHPTPDGRNHPAVARSPHPSHGALPNRDVFLLATVVPGLGQYYTHRPLLGALVTTATVAALYYGFEPRTVTTEAPTPETRTTHPHLAMGLIAAGGISALAAAEAALYASKPHRSSHIVLDVSPSRVGVWLPVALQGRLAVGAVLASNAAAVR